MTKKVIPEYKVIVPNIPRNYAVLHAGIVLISGAVYQKVNNDPGIIQK